MNEDDKYQGIDRDNDRVGLITNSIGLAVLAGIVIASIKTIIDWIFT